MLLAPAINHTYIVRLSATPYTTPEVKKLTNVGNINDLHKSELPKINKELGYSSLQRMIEQVNIKVFFVRFLDEGMSQTREDEQNVRRPVELLISWI